MSTTRSTPRQASPRPAFDSPEQAAWLQLWRTYDRLKSIEEDLFAEYELNPQQYNALRLLEAAAPGKLPTLAIAAGLVSRAPDITRLLDKLEQRSLIRRERPAGNRRVVEVQITTAGRQLLKELAPRVRDCHVRQLGHLGKQSLNQLIHLLKQVRAPHET